VKNARPSELTPEFLRNLRAKSGKVGKDLIRLGGPDDRCGSDVGHSVELESRRDEIDAMLAGDRAEAGNRSPVSRGISVLPSP